MTLAPWLLALLACGGGEAKSPRAGEDTAPTLHTPGTGGTTPTGSTGSGAATIPTGTGTLTPTGDTGPTAHTGDTAAVHTGDTGRLHTGDTAPPPPPCLPRVIAHRGASGTAPEDTLVALERAFSAGVRMAEVDVRVSADGHAFLLHDQAVDRTTRELGPGEARTLAELAALDAGRKYIDSHTP